MTAMHPSQTWRGCALCKPQKRRGLGWQKQPTRFIRQLGGKRAAKHKQWETP